ncbi:MAG TPA: hypothetical protein VHP33_10410 [Polyangiaceae bacterium]|nr:hypothetical protein [Polyangiaceae bacterium]
MTFRKLMAAFCRGFADAIDPPTPAPPIALLPDEIAALPPVAPGDRALTQDEFNHALCAIHLRRALRRYAPDEMFQA